MNIFITSECPYEAAKNLDNKRVVKMVLESTQMLCTAINECAGKQITPYKSTHVNHPSNIWARKTDANWFWLYKHAWALSEQYTKKYNKTHKCESILLDIFQYMALLPQGKLTPFANCAAHAGLGLDFKHVEPVTEAYKAYLKVRWANDKRTPEWLFKPDFVKGAYEN